MAERSTFGDDAEGASAGGRRTPGEDALLAAGSGIERLRRYRSLLEAAGPKSERLEALDAAIRLLTRAIAGMSDTDESVAAYRHNLSLALQSRYDECRELSDLERAAETLLLGLANPASAGRYSALLRYNVGVVLRRIHRVTRDRGLLTVAEAELAPVLDYVQTEHVDPLDCQYEYGRIVLALAESSADADVPMDKAVSVFARLVNEADPDLPDYPAYLDSLGSAHLNRFDRRGERADVDAAVEFAGRAVGAERERGAWSTAALANFGAALRARGVLQAGESEDLDEAVCWTREALALADSASERAGVLSNLRAWW
ncbi:hypothetical protein [Streptacidiphilus sp. EB103A]|uniref:hypothetical protein n=1 Tax=Streptacidiphilus sp. EB103A TaxID=3156275 RepID=UPI003513C3E2